MDLEQAPRRGRALSLVQRNDRSASTSLERSTSPHARAQRAASPPPPYLPDSLVSESSYDADTISHSLYSYSYSQGTAQVVQSRLWSITRALERLKASGEADSHQFNHLIGSQTAFSLPQDDGTSDLDSYLSVISEALHRLTEGPGPLAEQTANSRIASSQKLSMPLINSFRRESTSWLRSVSRIIPDYQCDTDSARTDQFKDSVKLLEILSTPIVDVVRPPIVDKPTMLRRGSSYVSLPMLEKLAETEPESQSQPPTYDPTPLSQIPAKFASRNAVFTTSNEEPYKILSLNDIACLMFGTSQHDAINRSLLDFISETGRERILTDVKTRKHPIFLCGRLVDIVKDKQATGLASLWVERSDKFIIWVIEEVQYDYLEIIDGKTNAPEAMAHLNLDSFPGIFDKSPHDLHYYCVSVSDKNVPVLVSHDNNKFVQVRAPHVISGAVVIDKNRQIRSYNLSAIHNLLGMGLELVSQTADAIIPKISIYRKEIERILSITEIRPGTVITEHMFRQVACRSAQDYFDYYPRHGVAAMNRDGNEISVDVQMRFLAEGMQVLWISYSRAPLSDEQCVVPSQLDLLQAARRRPRSSQEISSTSSFDDLLTPTTSHNASPPPEKVEAEKPAASAKNQPSAEPESSSKSVSRTSTPAYSSPSYSTRDLGIHRRELQFSDFKVIRTLGEGAYGEVLLVVNSKEPELGEIALKCISKDRILVDTWTRDRKLGTIPNEIKILNLLRTNWHPNIVELIDFFEDDKYYHVEMGRHGDPAIDLFDLIESKPDMDETECRDIYRQVVSAVVHLHGLGIVHRDIKDENIIVDQNGFVKLVDFGSAAFTKQGPFDIFVGTVDYAAPEVLEGVRYEGLQQDVWALGILLYTLVYKENPFTNLDEILEATVRIPYDVSIECTSLINSILLKDYKARPTAEWIGDHAWLEPNLT